MNPCGICGTPVDDDYFCFGCKEYICDRHGDSPYGGSHKVDAHAEAEYNGDDDTEDD